MADGSDIVERLADRIGHPHSHYISPDIALLMDAKAEITRLRAQAHGWRAGVEAAAGVADDYAETHDRENRTAYTVEYAVRSLACKELAEEIAATIRSLPSPPAEGGK